MNADLTAIVLAGGRSTRFGADKLLVDVEGMTILERTLVAASALAANVIVAGASRASLPAIAGPTIRAIDDIEPFGGPLRAVSGALAATSTDLAVVVGGDMPSIVPSVLELLLDRLRSDPVVDAVVLGDPIDLARRQPLPLGLRSDAARIAAAAALDAGERSLVRLLDRLRAVEIPADRWLPLDPEGRTLLDVDVPADLDRLLRGAPDQRMR